MKILEPAGCSFEGAAVWRGRLLLVRLRHFRAHGPKFPGNFGCWAVAAFSHNFFQEIWETDDLKFPAREIFVTDENGRRGESNPHGNGFPTPLTVIDSLEVRISPWSTGWHDVAWRDMTHHDTTRHEAMRRHDTTQNTTRRNIDRAVDVTWRDVTWPNSTRHTRHKTRDMGRKKGDTGHKTADEDTRHQTEDTGQEPRGTSHEIYQTQDATHEIDITRYELRDTHCRTRDTNNDMYQTGDVKGIGDMSRRGERSHEWREIIRDMRYMKWEIRNTG